MGTHPIFESDFDCLTEPPYMLRAVWWPCGRATTKRILKVKPDAPIKSVASYFSLNAKNDQIRPSEFGNAVGISTRGIHNNRNNEGFLNKSIRIGSSLGRTSVTATVGNFDRTFGTEYTPQIFSFQGDILKGFWRWYDACDDVKNVFARLEIKPKYYREHVNFQLIFDSMRGIPVMLCCFIPGGFVILGSSVALLPTWVIFPRTFWNLTQIKRFIQSQHQKRKDTRRIALHDIESRSFCANPVNFGHSKNHRLSAILKPMFAERDSEGNRNYLRLSEIKPYFKTGEMFSLERLSLETLCSLAKGHGLYFIPRLRMRTLLEWQLKRIARNISLQDRMIKRELLIGYMTQRELDWACFRRGLNPQHKQRLEQESFLRDWIRRSNHIDVNSEPAELLFNIVLLPHTQKLRASSLDDSNPESTKPILPPYY